MAPEQYVVLLDNDLSVVNHYKAVIGKHLEASRANPIVIEAFTDDDQAEAFIKDNASQILACIQDIKRIGFGGAWFYEYVIERYIPEALVFIISSMGKFIKLGRPGEKSNECLYYSKPATAEDLKSISEAIIDHALKQDR